MYLCRACSKIFEKPEKVPSKNTYRNLKKRWRYQCPACKKAYFKHLDLIVKAVLITKHFDFEAYGRTQEEARKILMEGIKIHCLQMDSSYETFCSHYCEGNNNYIKYISVYVGCVYRDNGVILT